MELVRTLANEPLTYGISFFIYVVAVNYQFWANDRQITALEADVRELKNQVAKLQVDA